ncbi:MAG TPA: hypothetical protein VL947_02305, partial [Cytophagales bacterium]|nr:hypothetical protein [Cytophagales bacterium]
YKAKDLEGLTTLHGHIMSGNALSHEPQRPDTVINPDALKHYLQKRKQELEQRLGEIKESQLYIVLNVYKSPLDFVVELSEQLAARLIQLQKRTRKANKLF